MRAQLLDGSATSVLDTVRRLGFLQIDPISTVAPPQQLVLWSRLGPYDVAELDRLLWDEQEAASSGTPSSGRSSRCRSCGRGCAAGERALRARAARRRVPARERRASGATSCASSSATGRCSRASSRTTPRGRGRVAPLVRAAASVSLMLEILHGRGVVAVVGRRNGQRLWDLAERWYPAVETMSAARGRAGARGAALPRAGRAADAEGLGGASGCDRRPGSGSRDVPLPVRPPRPRPRPRGGALRLPLPARDVRAEGEARVRLLRAADPRRRPPRRPHRAALRPQDEDARGARRVGRHVACGRGAREPRDLARRRARACPRIPRDALRDARDPRGPGAGPGDGRDHDADLPDLDLRAGGGRRPQGLRLRARREPDADRAAGVPRLARGSRARARVLVRARRRDDAHAPALAGRPRRRRQRRLRRHLPHVHAGLRAEGLPLHVPHAGRDLDRARRAPRRADEVRLARDADEPGAEHRRHRGGVRGGRTRSARSSSSTTPSRRRTSSSRSRSAPTSCCTRRRSTSAATPT